MIFQQERYRDIADEAMELLEMHYREIAWNKEKIPLLVDRKTYFLMEDAGSFVVYTAREEGVLKGYAAFFIKNHPHYALTKYATNDVIFIHPASRGGVGIKLIKYSEAELKKLGADVITLHVKKILDWGVLAQRLGYEAADTIWQKWIGD